MSKPRPKFMDALEAVSASDSDEEEQTAEGQKGTSGPAPAGANKAAKQQGEASTSSSSSEDEEEDAKPASKRAKPVINFEDLQKKGYKSGPSVLLMKAPQEEGQTDWSWSSGKEAKSSEAQYESQEERARNRVAATSGAEQSAELAMKASELAAQLREARQREREQQREEQRLTFNQKEKRKRDAGQASRGKNYVEEEKRMARQFGVYSGFD